LLWAEDLWAKINLRNDRQSYGVTTENILDQQNPRN